MPRLSILSPFLTKKRQDSYREMAESKTWELQALGTKNVHLEEKLQILYKSRVLSKVTEHLKAHEANLWLTLWSYL